MLEIINIKNSVQKSYRNFRYFYTKTEITFNDEISVQQRESLISDFKITSKSSFEEYKVLDAVVKKNTIQLITAIPYFYVNHLGIYNLSYESGSGIHGLCQGDIYSIEPIPLDERNMTPYVNFIECAEVEESCVNEHETYEMLKGLKYKSHRFEPNFFYVKEFFNGGEYYGKKVAIRFQLWENHEAWERFFIQVFGRIKLYINGKLWFRNMDTEENIRYQELDLKCRLEDGINNIFILYDPVYFSIKDPLNRIVGIAVRCLLSDNQNVPVLIQSEVK